MDNTRINNQMNLVRIIEEGLKNHLHEKVTEQLVNKMVMEFKEKVEPIIKTEVEKVTLHSINNMKDLLNMRDELKVYMEWVGEKKND